MTNRKHSTGDGPKDVILDFLAALNQEEFDAARKLVHDDMSFDGVLAQRHSADTYFKDMEKMKMKYAIKKTFADDDDVCILSDVTMKDITMFTCSWYKVHDGKIKSLKVVFDPRPAL